MAPYIAQMVIRVAADLQVAEGGGNVRAKTAGHLWLVGREEAISTVAVALIERKT